MGQFRNLGYFTAICLFAATVSIYIVENMIARGSNDCTIADDKTMKCGKDSALKSLRKGIDAQQLMMCTDTTGRAGYNVTSKGDNAITLDNIGVDGCASSMSNIRMRSCRLFV